MSRAVNRREQAENTAIKEELSETRAGQEWRRLRVLFAKGKVGISAAEDAVFNHLDKWWAFPENQMRRAFRLGGPSRGRYGLPSRPSSPPRMQKVLKMGLWLLERA